MGIMDLFYGHITLVVTYICEGVIFNKYFFGS